MKNSVIETVNGTIDIVQVPDNTDLRTWCNDNLNGYEFIVFGSSRFDVYENASNPLHDSNNYIKRG